MPSSSRTMYTVYVTLLCLAVSINPVHGTCTYPSQFQNVKWFSRYDLTGDFPYWHTFQATTMTTLRGDSWSNLLKPVMTCVAGSGTATSFYTMVTYLAFVPTCFHLNYQRNVMVVTEDNPTKTDPKTVATCTSLVVPTIDKQIWIADPTKFQDCPFTSGIWKAVYSQTTGANTCAGNANSKATVTGQTLDLKTCYSGPDAYATPFNRKLKCVQSFVGSMVDKDDNGKVLILATEPDVDSTNKTRFYCARYKEEAGKVYMSVDVTPKNDRKTMCDYDKKFDTVGTSAGESYIAFTFSDRQDFTTAAPSTTKPATTMPTTVKPTTTKPPTSPNKPPTTTTKPPTTTTKPPTTTTKPPTTTTPTQPPTTTTPCTITCQNGGTCMVIRGKSVCNCPAGKTGTTCDTDIPPCTMAPCQNGGTCTEMGAKYNCTCATGFSGDKCQTNERSVGKMSQNDLILLVVLLCLLAAIIFVSVCIAVFICQTRRKRKEDKLLTSATGTQSGDGYSGKPSWYPSYKSTK